ncbi:MAG: thioredoxin [Ruminococcaceae bacterium]|nr:thioredoxin [Oscillospiraceae bacterium]
MSALSINKHNFEKEILNSGKKVLLDFFSPRCGPCRFLSPIVDELGRELSDVVVAKVNVDEENELASSFGIFSIPTLVVMEKGKILNRAVGARPKREILNML